MDGTLGIILNRWKPHVKFISLWLVVWDTRTTIKQLERSEILSEGTFVIFSLTRRGMLYNVFNKFFEKMVLQYGNNAPSEMVSSYCVTHNKNS